MNSNMLNKVTAHIGKPGNVAKEQHPIFVFLHSNLLTEYFLFLDKVTTLAHTFWRALPAQVQRLSLLSSMIPSLWLCQCKNSMSACWDVLPVCFYFWRGEATDKKRNLEKRKRMSWENDTTYFSKKITTTLSRCDRTYCELSISSKVAVCSQWSSQRFYTETEKPSVQSKHEF